MCFPRCSRNGDKIFIDRKEVGRIILLPQSQPNLRRALLQFAIFAETLSAFSMSPSPPYHNDFTDSYQTLDAFFVMSQLHGNVQAFCFYPSHPTYAEAYERESCKGRDTHVFTHMGSYCVVFLPAMLATHGRRVTSFVTAGFRRGSFLPGFSLS